MGANRPPHRSFPSEKKYPCLPTGPGKLRRMQQATGSRATRRASGSVMVRAGQYNLRPDRQPRWSGGF